MLAACVELHGFRGLYNHIDPNKIEADHPYLVTFLIRVKETYIWVVCGMLLHERTTKNNMSFFKKLDCLFKTW
jgi:hypothetical protein